jgi:gliding motility-associated-like protein
MLKKLLFTLALCIGCNAIAQQCPVPLLTSPENGDTDIPVNTQISWNGVAGVPAYLVSIGTTPLGSEILNRQNVGNATSYTPPMGLPADTDIYITITLFFFQAGVSEITCSTETFRTAALTDPPPCTALSAPGNGAVNVNLGSRISWNYAPTADSYDLVVGTSPGVGDIFNDNVGNELSFDPPGDLPANTTIYVTITPRNTIGPAIDCQELQFTTGQAAALPGCTSLIRPEDGEINVPLSPVLEWEEVPDAIGYLVTIGLSPFSTEILDNTTFASNSTNFIEFEPNRTFFIRIIPYNEAGSAIGCVQESFSTILGCGPFFDTDTGELITLNPEIQLPDILAFCENEGTLTITSPDEADDFRWYQLDEFGEEIYLGDGESIELTETGIYRYEAINRIMQEGNEVECSSTKVFEVTSSETATIISLDIDGQAGILRIEARVSGNGDYEFALDDINGPYQDGAIFDNVPAGSHTVYVRDRNGCGIVSQSIDEQTALDGFPRFFTPNGDGFNDFWQYVPPPALEEIPLNNIQVYDRYGKLLANFGPDSAGWDGTFNGNPLPSDDYWFRAEVDSQGELKGHFTLKR